MAKTTINKGAKMNINNNHIVQEDMLYILANLNTKEQEKFQNSTILITGCAGFLGFYFLNFFTSQGKKLGIKKIIALDNFMLGYPQWLQQLQEEYHSLIKVEKFNIISDKIENINGAEEADLIIHAASVASPVFYRQYPLETLDANVWGLRNLLDFFSNKRIKGFLFFSSSEIYGDPAKDKIPTDEEYRGNVACIGPRACYDESKRIGETICSIFSQRYNLPITIARPFNNYGPGIKIDDKRLPADFAKSILTNQDIVILSDGTPTRTLCYIADAIAGYLKVLLHDCFDYFNIGMDKPEFSITELAETYAEIGKKDFGFTKNIIYKISEDKNYLTDCPARRCPNINKARNILGYNPSITLQEGVKRFLVFLAETEL